MLLRVRHADGDRKGFDFMNQACLGHEIREKESSRNVDREMEGTKMLYEVMKMGNGDKQLERTMKEVSGVFQERLLGAASGLGQVCSSKAPGLRV